MREKTKLTMHSRVTMVTAGRRNRYIGGFETGMTMSLERLVRPSGMEVRNRLFVERTFDAPAERIWSAPDRKRGDESLEFLRVDAFEPEGRICIQVLRGREV